MLWLCQVDGYEYAMDGFKLQCPILAIGASDDSWLPRGQVGRHHM